MKPLIAIFLLLALSACAQELITGRHAKTSSHLAPAEHQVR